MSRPAPEIVDPASERSPLLDTQSDHTEDDSVPPPAPSSLSLIASHSFQGSSALVAQIGITVATVVLWRVLWTHPAGLFTYHPSFQSLALLGFLEGILLLQPQPVNSTIKHKSLQLHQVCQYSSLLLIVTGAAFIVYNKAVHGAKHFITWHARCGLATLILILLQITFGALMVYAPLQRVIFGGEGQAKRAWKYHRLSGYFTLTLLLVTPLLALASDWVIKHTDKWERWTIGVGLSAAGLAAFARVQTSKLGLKRN
ncbi:hypothetical protein JCM11641_008286 [Rhodosporidiobolus odoratus]